MPCPSRPRPSWNRSLFTVLVLNVGLLPVVPAAALAADDSRGPIAREAQPLPDRGLKRYVSDGSVLARFDFEGTDPQGWQSVDIQEAGRNHWHVDDFAGLGPGYAPLSGAQSLWCGVRPEEVPPGWTYSDGYGNNWNDVYQVQAFSAPLGTSLEMELRYDLEELEDWLHVEFRHGDGPWQWLESYTGIQSTTMQVQLFVPPPFDGNDDTTIRWRVETDDIGSDEYLGANSNGAAILDYIVIRNAAGDILRFEDFEGESVGDQTTNNGWFFAPPREATEMGNRGALVSGTGVFQEDPLGPNTGHFWSFYQGSSDTYRCDIEPSQSALPRALDLADPTFSNSLRNRLQSPWIDLADVIEGDPNVGIQPRLEISFRGYLDNPQEEQVRYRFELRWQMGGVEIPEWHVVPIYYYGTSRRWSNYVHFFDIPDGATHVQVGITVFDLAWSQDPAGAADLCHSHAPLIDDIVIGRRARLSIVVTNVDDGGPGSLRQAIEEANETPGPDRILFDIDGTGREIVAQSPLPIVQGPCVIDATFFPGHSGIDRVSLANGYSNFSPIMGLTLADSVVVRGLALYDFFNRSRTAPSAGMQILGSDNVVEDCWIGVRPDGAVAPNFHGIQIEDDTQRNRIGGPEPGQANRIEGNAADGVVLDRNAWSGNTIRGNRIVDNGGMAVDVGRNGETANDPGDVDDGPNGYQNHPIVTAVNGPLGRVELMLSSLPGVTYTIDLYRDTACGDDGRGQGREYLGWTEVTTDATGEVQFVFEVGEPLPVGEVVVATATDPFGSTSEYSTCGVVEQSTGVPGPRRVARELLPNVPNPFNPRTQLRFTLSATERVRLEIVDVAGRLVSVLADATLPAGEHHFVWEGTDGHGRSVASGVYLSRLRGEGWSEVRKVALVR